MIFVSVRHVLIKTIIHLSVDESPRYIPCCLAVWWISTTIHLHFGELVFKVKIQKLPS